MTAFGLGDEPSGFVAQRVVGWNFADHEEYKASVLGICYERALGLDWWKTADEHSWIEGWGSIEPEAVLQDQFFATIAKLNRRGLLRGWMPTVLP